MALSARIPVRGDSAVCAETRAPGNPPDLVEAYERHYSQLFAYCMSILRHRDDAEDAVQETFARAAANRTKLEGELLPYLSTVARNVSIDMIRQRRRRGPEIDEEHPDGRRGPEPRAVDRYMLQQTWRLLSNRDRLLLAHSFAGFAYDEISRRTGLSPKSVSVGICRAREHSRLAASAVASLLLPAVLRRLLGRLRSAAANPQAATAALTGLEQGGLLAASMLVALVGGAVVSPSSPQRAATPLLASAAAASAPAAVTLGAGSALPPGSVSAPAAPAGPGPAAPLPQLTAPDQGAQAVFAQLPGHQASQQDTQVYSMTASPHYAQDHTVYAAGAVFTGCLAMNACPALFRSQDGGSSWTMLPATGYSGGSVILPAAYPADPTIFVTGQAGLQRSDDGGRTFLTVVPYPAPAAVVPGTSASDTQIVVASSPVAIYLARQHTVVPGPALPAGVVADDIAFSDASHMVVTGHRSVPALEGVVAQCDSGGSCTEVAHMPGEVLHVAGTPLSSGQNLTAVWSAQHVWVSRDGATFTAAPLPAGALVSAAAFGPAGLAVATYEHDAAQALHSQLLTSADGVHFAPVASLPSPGVQLDAVLPLAGRMLVGLATPDPQDHVGVRCSTDGGRSWRASC